MTDPYGALGLEPGASIDEVRAAYRHLARQCHPDRFTDAPPEEQRAALERMQEINVAFAVLTDPAERARFERQRKLRERRSGAGDGQPNQTGGEAADASGPGERVRFRTQPREDESRSADEQAARSNRAWRAESPPADLELREFNGWGDAHWVYVHAPGGRAAKMDVTTGEVTIEREELREDVLRLLQHYALDSWS